MSQRGAPLDSLTGLRWWAAFAVFFFHMTAFAPLPIFPLFDYGNYGVMFFFVLSGFVLSWSWKSSLPVRAFYLRRIGRIWPSAMVALILAIPVFYSFNPDPSHWWVKPVDLGILLLSVPLIQGWWLAPAILFSGNPAAWTLTCEFFFYSLHPVFQRLYIKLSNWVVFGALFLLIAVLFVVKSICTFGIVQGCFVLPLPIERLPEFLLGMGLGVMAGRGLLLKSSPWWFLSLLLGFFIFLAFGQSLGIAGPVIDFARLFANEITLVLMVLTIASVAQKDILDKKTSFKSAWLVKLGEVSFAFYLVHATVMYVFVDIFGQLSISWGNIIWYPIVLGAGLLISFGLHLWIEKPFEAKFRLVSNKIKPV